MSDYLVSLIRTAVPAGWGLVVAWLVSRNLLPTELAAQAEGFSAVLTAVAAAGWYAAARWLEGRPWFPRWLAVVLLGSAKVPNYDPSKPSA